jgi:Glycosyl hydrolase family 26/PA14 domain
MSACRPIIHQTKSGAALAAGQRLAKLFACVAALLLAASTSAAFIGDTPVTPGASPEAQSLLGWFSGIYGTKIIAGQHDGWRQTNGLSEELNYITNTTGKLPALVEWDLGGATATNRDTEHHLMKYAVDWAQSRHGIVGFSWHWRAPLDEPAVYTKETKFDISRAVTEGTPEYAAAQHDFDLIAGELEVLRDARVPVLWRPLHEANGRWFWWGAHGPEPFKKLWRMMFENFTVKHHLNNLLWDFSPGAETDLAEWYPGDAFVDIVGADHYPMDGNHNSAKEIFDELAKMTRGQKLIAFGENGPVPDPAQLEKDQAGWLFFTVWSGSILFEKTTQAQLRAYYQNPYVVTLADLPDWKNLSIEPAGKAAKLSFLGAPCDVAVAGTWRMPLSVAVRDANGKTVRDGNHAVLLALRKSGRAKLSGTLTAATVNGIATFSDLGIDAPVNGSRLVASAEHLHGATSAPFSVGPGNGLLREWWTNGKDFSTPPDGTEILGSALETPVQIATNFSARIRGLLIAPQSGEYQFAIADTGGAELWLGSGDSPASAVKIAAVTGGTPYRKWPHINETDSQVVNLVTSRKYYFEIRQRQSAGSTQLHVRWRMPDGSEERPIPAYRFELPKS